MAPVLAVLATLVAVPAAAGEIENAIEANVARLRAGERVTLGTAGIASTVVLPELYERYGYASRWTDASLDSLAAIVAESFHDGLDPADYHSRELGARPRGGSASERADLDLIATDALIRLVYHLYFGKVDPERLDADWNFTRELGEANPVDVIASAIDSVRIRELGERARPRHRLYRDLCAGLARYRAIAIHGGWPKLGEGPTLSPGARDPRVPTLRRRLVVTGELAEARADTSTLYDATLEQAVRAFQALHLMTQDGSVGPATRAALDVPVEARIDQIRVNLERSRWVLHDLPERFIVVNVAGFEVFDVVGLEPKWRARCQVGSSARKTPIFRSDMRYLVFNPTWTVPPGIAEKDILPSLRRGDLSVLQRKKLKVIDSKGRVVSPSSVKWSGMTAARMPYLLRQDPGPHNALGRVKFMFPNDHAVYLHDTPSRSLFDETSRAFSSGCIRVDRPLELAERVLADPKWDAAAIQRVVDSGETTNVPLARPLPVLLLYWTALSPDPGHVAFAPDIYGRDAAILAGLSGPFRLRKTIAAAGAANRPTASR